MILGNAELFDAMLKTAVGVLISTAFAYLALGQRDLRHSLRRQRDQLAQHRRAIVQLQGAAIHPPTSVRQPMSVVQPRNPRPAMAIPAHHHAGQEGANGGWKQAVCDTDATLRLARPPALGDVEAAMAKASRALTPTELAARLDRQPWDCLPELEWLLKAGRIQTVPGHTAGRTAYRLADQTERMPHGMSVLPGVVR